MSKRKNHITDVFKGCLDQSFLFSYVEGSLSRSELKKIETHLNVCTSCFQEMTSLVRNSLSPMNKDEKSVLLNIEKLSPAEQIAKILAYQEQGYDSIKDSEKRQILSTVSIFRDALKKFISGFAYSRQKFRPAMAVITLFLLAVGVFHGMIYLRTEYPVRHAQQLLKGNYSIYIENTRLSGGYPSTGISMLMSSVEVPPSYLEAARNNLLKVVHYAPKSSTAIRLLAQIYLIEKSYVKADSLLSSIRNESGHTALVLNDLGVLFAEQKEWGKAATQFQSALDVDNLLLEAYYNLALMKIKLGSTEEAISLLTTYVRLESEDAWKDAARHILGKIGHKKDPV